MTVSAQRSRWIAFFIMLVLFVCAVRLVSIQIFEGPTLAAEGQAVRTQTTSITPRRGAITDAKGVVLADSVQAYHIAVNQVNIRNWVHYEEKDGVTTDKVLGRGPAHAAQLLAPLLDMDPAELGGKMLGDATYIYVKKNVDPVTFREIRKLDIHGIEWEAVYERIYPNDNTAAPIIGTINAEGQGQGLEYAFNDILKGTEGKEAFEIAPNGAVMPGGKKTTVEPVDGATVRTTVHADLQHLIQQKLDARVAEHQADWGAVVITEVGTGRVLALADSNSKAPDTATIQPVAGVQYAFEPGSVGKIVTVAAAIEAGKVTPTTSFVVADRMTRDDSDGPITDFHPHETMEMTTTGILAESSNVGTVLVGETITDQQRADLMQSFGFGQPTGIELPGESAGSLRPPEQWVSRDRYTTMFGQAYSVNALQAANLMATLGNGGVRVDPRIIDSWTMPDGTVHTPQAPTPVQVVSSKTAKEVVSMMESVVSTDIGTGEAAAVDGYRVAVKTGTADIFVDGQPAVVATTAGLVPADAPRLAIAVVLYNPKVKVVSSESAAPLFGEVTREAVRNLGVPASAKEATPYPLTPQ
ncbi:MAG: penicillin-binding protein 2 [Actinomycetaceae bacterium]|nr:penicillin-binding protein 2 [Actinomycetaceae bacterium]